MIIVAHRGGAAEAPENTLVAIKRALAHGINHFEVDLRLTADDQLVLLHDSNLKRTTGVDGFIDETHSRELADIAVTGEGIARHAARIPLLDDVMQHCTPIHSIQLELKSDERTDTQRLGQVVCQWLDDQRSLENIIVTSFDIELLGTIRQANTRVKIGVVNKDCINKAMQDVARVYASHLCLNHHLLTTTDALNALGDKRRHSFRAVPLHLSVWTVNDQRRLDELKKFDVQSIITDRPTQLSPA